MATAVVRDTSISAGRQEEHLIFKRIRRERPAMAEYYGLSAAPVLVVDLCAVFGGNRAHRVFSFAGRYGRIRMFGRCGERRGRQARGGSDAGCADQDASPRCRGDGGCRPVVHGTLMFVYGYG